MPPRRIGLNPLDTNQTPLFSNSSALNHSPTATTSTATSRSTSPTPATSLPPHHHSQPGANGGIGGTDYCQSPDSFYPPPTTSIATQISAPRRRDTSTVIGMNANSSNGTTPPKDSNLARRHSPASSPQASLPRNEIPFIGGGFSQSQRSIPTKRGSMSNQGLAYFGGGKRGRCTRLLGLVAGVVVIWWISTNWRNEREPRRKLSHRWWEQEDSLSPEDLSALLPRPTLNPRPPPLKPPPTLSSHSLSQLLKLPSTLSTSSPSFRSHADYTVVIHLTSSSQLPASHLQPLLQSLANQSPLPPTRILLLCPSGMEPQPSVLSSFGPLVSILDYSPNQPPLLALANAATSTITTNFILFVDGHLPSSSQISKDYVRVMLHAFGTKEYSASVLSAGGLSISTSSSRKTPRSNPDTCIYPSHDTAKKNKAISQRITVPSTPFLFPVAWLLPRSYSSPPSSSNSKEQTITPTSPTILQGIPLSLPLEIALTSALWTKSGIPVYALPLSLGSESNGIDGWACERLKRNLEGSDEDGLKLRTRESFMVHKNGGEGLRRIQGDRKKGGVSSKKAIKLEKNAMERAKEMRKGSFVILLSGREELEATRKVACRFSGGFDHSDDEVLGGDFEVGDRELRVVVADWGERDQELEDQENGECHLEITPLTTAGSSSSDVSISLPLIDMLDSSLYPPPAFVLYLSDGNRAREFEEVLKWMGGMFGVRRGGERLSRIRMEKEAIGGGEGNKGRMTVVGIEKEEVRRAEWIGALPIEALRHWHTPRIDVSVITNDRPVSLHRLLTSLQSTHYFGDDVSLALNLEQTTDRLTHRLVDDFRWNHGPLSLRHRILLGGLMPAIVESWYPTSNDTYGVLLEDDVEVSPLFYGWLKFTILKYRYTVAGRAASSRLFGVSLYQQKNIELRPEGRQPFDAHKLFESLSLHSTTPYLSQIPCSWGAAYFPEVWREFHSYLSLRLSEIALPISEPIVPAIRSNRWPRSWKKYFIELVYLRGYSMLYPNYPGFESLSTNHLEKGTHVKTSQVEEKKKVLFEVPLLDVDGSLVDSLPAGQLPEWDSLPVMDLWGSLASPEELVERGWQTTRQIGSCKNLPNLDTPRLKYDARELLCRKVWDRETEGRLVRAQPLAARDEGAELDQGRMEAAKAEKEEDTRGKIEERTQPERRRDGEEEEEELGRERRNVKLAKEESFDLKDGDRIEGRVGEEEGEDAGDSVWHQVKAQA
ncbi:hypothetical protein JCM5353_003427 [Sporobolomyces roseus]